MVGSSGLLAYTSVMDTTVDIGEPEQVLRRLKSEHVSAAKRAITALNAQGPESEAFRAANREAQALKRRIEAIACFSVASSLQKM
jgi:hypothetical protein